ncbi:MAG: deoxyribodipyrimidine photo-lyase [Gammaproteobacteria bacterium]|nr:deoxyribodipyrimidine photo-lyase [Gammaproteobacteria bacterium]
MSKRLLAWNLLFLHLLQKGLSVGSQLTISVVWFRRDLRIQNNDALRWAVENSDVVLPVYIHCDGKNWPLGAASRWWLHQSLQKLELLLKGFGLQLHFYKGDSQIILKRLIDQIDATDLVFNKVYEPNVLRSDEFISNSLQKSVNIHSFESGLFSPPGSILNKQHLPYRVFTAFYKNLRPKLTQLDHNGLFQYQRLSKKSFRNIKTIWTLRHNGLSSLELIDKSHWHHKLSNHWQPGEQNAEILLQTFITHRLGNYPVERDFPALSGTSMLSAYLHFGEVTPQTIYSRLQPVLNGEDGAIAMNAAEVFIKQLIWREFAQHILWHFPHTAIEPMNIKFSDSFWSFDQNKFTQWTRGETGVALVDAGMKQLWETGWMHNRVRMIVSSFLTKNLGIHWRHGAQWFWDTLVDADLANNSMGWQWVAGCGVDAAPYYRVFNPLRQAERFDKNLSYIKKWVPLHLDQDYPAPIVDLASSREAALSRYKTNII